MASSVYYSSSADHVDFWVEFVVRSLVIHRFISMQRVKKLRELTTKHAKLPLAFVGSAYDGVGLNDAIMSSKTQVQSVFQERF